MDNSAVAVSAVIPAYNVGRYIAKAVESALAQTWTDLEVVVVDDGSSDDTPARLAAIPDPRLRIFRQTNRGLAAARNAGIAAARGRYIALLDGDDWWTPAKIAKHMALMESRPDLDMTFSLSQIADEDGAAVRKMNRKVSGLVPVRRLLVDNVVANGSSPVLRKTALLQAGGFDGCFQACADYDMWIRVALLRPGNLYCIPEPLTVYRMRSGQMTRNAAMIEEEWLRVIEKVERIAPEDAAAAGRAARAHLYRYLGYIAYEGRQYQESAAWLKEAFRYVCPALLTDNRTWVLAGALLAAGLLPRPVFTALDAAARASRARAAAAHQALS